MSSASLPIHPEIINDEILSFTRQMAKDLVFNTIYNFQDDYNEQCLETDVTQQIIIEPEENHVPVALAPKPNPSGASRFNNPALEPNPNLLWAPQAGLGEVMGSASSAEEENMEIDEDLPIEEASIANKLDASGIHDWKPKIDDTVSQIFKRPDNHSESSIIPFGLLGESPEVLYQKFSKEGYLQKKSSNLFLGWQKRYFEIRGFKMYYSKTVEMLRDRKEVRCINLFVSPCRVVEAKGQTIQIAIDGVKKKMNLKASSLVEAKEWANFFNEVFTFVEKNAWKAAKYITRKREKLLKIDIMTEEEFLNTVDTGDILLFKSTHMAAKLQRTFTSSNYDHVGLLVRAFDDIYLYDSVMSGGVQLTNWKDFKRNEYHKDYFRIAYRKLEIKDQALRNIIQEDLFKFVTEHTGKKYELNIGKLLRWNSTNYGKIDGKKLSEKQPQPKQEAGFFCSELVAAAYKAVELLNPTVASSRYLPVSFSQKKGLKLLRGANLSNEYGLALTDEKAKRVVY